MRSGFSSFCQMDVHVYCIWTTAVPRDLLQMFKLLSDALELYCDSSLRVQQISSKQQSRSWFRELNLGGALDGTPRWWKWSETTCGPMLVVLDDSSIRESALSTTGCVVTRCMAQEIDKEGALFVIKAMVRCRMAFNLNDMKSINCRPSYTYHRKLRWPLQRLFCCLQ